ncbi:type II toxin-antitoxin system ParD family antitoxin [Tabrizicola sp. M-4]|uniref:type II toxin-antitoxin system ParD family antitoxin n=1 Tax=Tabrizicola sp. M-4 TaxID=3055847 RepID=UPI003DAA44EE
MATMNISLPDQMKAFAESQAQSGRYANVSDYVRDLLRKDQQRLEAVVEVQDLVDQAIASGEAELFDMSSFIAEQKAK